MPLRTKDDAGSRLLLPWALGLTLTVACQPAAPPPPAAPGSGPVGGASASPPATGTPAAPRAATPPGEKLKVAFLYVGPVGDGGWSWAHDQARQQLEQTFPWVETAYLESVPEGAGAVRALSGFAEKGYKLILATSFGYMDPVLEVAARYPDTIFMHCSGYKRAKNVGTYFGRMEEAKYLAGIIAGKMSKSGKIGFVAPHPIPEVVRHINAFTLGVRAVAPTMTVHVVWTNSWFDPGKEKQAALSLLDAGCDVIATGADSVAPLQAAQERGALAIGYDSDGRAFAPRAFLTAPVWDWSVVYQPLVQQVRDGTWQSSDFFGGLASGVVKLAPLADQVPPAVRTLVAEAEQKLRTGELVLFIGPLVKQDGTLALQPGVKATDPEILKMDYFVQGVVGTLPR
ncbi:MAG: BMP family ABC transporter substrate-binding protein [Myxococcota bacterium]|jgi:basic membrane protein A|nr:BMP family ABC transporter substrate-binding protein [Myxococcota bacterium]